MTYTSFFQQCCDWRDNTCRQMRDTGHDTNCCVGCSNDPVTCHPLEGQTKSFPENRNQWYCGLYHCASVVRYAAAVPELRPFLGEVMIRWYNQEEIIEE